MRAFGLAERPGAGQGGRVYFDATCLIRVSPHMGACCLGDAGQTMLSSFMKQQPKQLQQDGVGEGGGNGGATAAVGSGPSSSSRSPDKGRQQPQQQSSLLQLWAGRQQQLQQSEAPQQQQLQQSEAPQQQQPAENCPANGQPVAHGGGAGGGPAAKSPVVPTATTSHLGNGARQPQPQLAGAKRGRDGGA